jgi:hypothetical protein
MVRDLLPKRFAKWVPSPMAMSIPFYIGAASVSELLLQLTSSTVQPQGCINAWGPCRFFALH